jgi:hypothetical protein
MSAFDNHLAVYFTPGAIRDRYDGEPEDDPRRVWAENATDAELREIGESCLNSDSLWKHFRELIDGEIDEVIS